MTIEGPGRSDTSRAAYRQSQEIRSKVARDILAAIRHAEAMGRTCDELEVELTLSHQTASASLTYLQRLDAIVDSGRRRPTRSGRQARVYVLSHLGPPAKATDEAKTSGTTPGDAGRQGRLFPIW